MRVLLVSKQAAIERYRSDELARLEADSARRLASMRRGARCHAESVDQVRALFADDDCRMARIEELDTFEVGALDLVVTVGGDGTVLAAHSLPCEAPLLAINSDPERSLGHFTRCHAHDAARIVDRWRAGCAEYDAVFRLQLRVDDAGPIPILNECLFSNANPALMSRYRLTIDDHSEEQHSSGVWLSTPAGSTGAIASAGTTPCPDSGPALLYHVREPFTGRGEYRLLRDALRPPRPVRLVPTTTGMTCYLDGAHRFQCPAAVGASVWIEPCPTPLRLLR